MKQQQQQQ